MCNPHYLHYLIYFQLPILIIHMILFVVKERYCESEKVLILI